MQEPLTALWTVQRDRGATLYPGNYNVTVIEAYLVRDLAICCEAIRAFPATEGCAARTSPGRS